MSEDMYEEVSVKSYGQRIKETITGVLFGFGLVIGAFVLLFWNEGRSVETYKTLKEGEGKVISISSDKINPQTNGKLVHTTGKADTQDKITDTLLGVSAKALIISRESQMYQWTERVEKETVKETGGSEKTITRYYYEKGWSSIFHNSSNFKKPQGHRNPASMPIKSDKIINKNVTLGAYKMPTNLVGQIGSYEALIPKNIENISSRYRQNASISGNDIYISQGGTPESPYIGDIKVSFNVALPQEVSILAQQQNNSFAKYLADAGGTIYVLYQGLHSSKAMFKQEHEDNVMLTWILRFVGFAMMVVGFMTIFKIFSVLLDVLPFLGNIMEIGVTFVSFMIGLILSLLTIAIAWLFYRPMISIGIFIVIGGIIYWFKIRKKKVVAKRVMS